jgi:hypothetical protein
VGWRGREPKEGEIQLQTDGSATTTAEEPSYWGRLAGSIEVADEAEPNWSFTFVDTACD